MTDTYTDILSERLDRDIKSGDLDRFIDGLESTLERMEGWDLSIRGDSCHVLTTDKDQALINGLPSEIAYIIGSEKVYLEVLLSILKGVQNNDSIKASFNIGNRMGYRQCGIDRDNIFS